MAQGFTDIAIIIKLFPLLLLEHSGLLRAAQWGEYIPANENLGYRITLPISYSSPTSYIVVCSNSDTENGYICSSAAKRIDEKQVDLASAINGDYYQTLPVSIICLGF